MREGGGAGEAGRGAGKRGVEKDNAGGCTRAVGGGRKTEGRGVRQKRWGVGHGTVEGVNKETMSVSLICCGGSKKVLCNLATPIAVVAQTESRRGHKQQSSCGVRPATSASSRKPSFCQDSAATDPKWNAGKRLNSGKLLLAFVEIHGDTCDVSDRRRHRKKDPAQKPNNGRKDLPTAHGGSLKPQQARALCHICQANQSGMRTKIISHSIITSMVGMQMVNR